MNFEYSAQQEIMIQKSMLLTTAPHTSKVKVSSDQPWQMGVCKVTHDDFRAINLINGIRAKLCFFFNLSYWLGIAQCAIQSIIDMPFEWMWCLLSFLWCNQVIPASTLRHAESHLQWNSFRTSRGTGDVFINKIKCPGPRRIVGSFGCTSRQPAPSFPQLFRSSETAEGIQCVVRISWVAAFAVFVSRTTNCQMVIGRTDKQ